MGGLWSSRRPPISSVGPGGANGSHGTVIQAISPEEARLCVLCAPGLHRDIAAAYCWRASRCRHSWSPRVPSGFRAWRAVQRHGRTVPGSSSWRGASVILPLNQAGTQKRVFWEARNSNQCIALVTVTDQFENRIGPSRAACRGRSKQFGRLPVGHDEELGGRGASRRSSRSAVLLVFLPKLDVLSIFYLEQVSISF